MMRLGETNTLILDFLGQGIGCRTHFGLSGNDLGSSQDFLEDGGKGYNPSNFYPVTSIMFCLIGFCALFLEEK